MDVSAILSTLAAMGLATLRENLVLARFANRQYENAIVGQSKNSTVNIVVPSAVAVQTVTPGATPPSTATTTPTVVPVTLTEHEEAPFYLNDTDMMKVSMGIIPMQAAEAAKALANKVEQTLFANYTKFYGYAGTAGTTPYATDLSTFLAARRIAGNQLMPKQDRYNVIDTDAESNALGLRNFQDASFSSDPSVLMDGVIGRKLGALWAASQLVPTHTAGTITTGLAAKAATAQALGDTTIVCTTAASTGACALVEGDIVTFAGHDQTYTMTAAATQASANSDVTLNISPGLTTALAGGEAVSVKSSHVVNLLLHRDAIAFAMAPLVEANIAPGLAYMQPIIDEESGLAMRLELTREHKRWRWSFDAMWGSAVPRPELGVRQAG